MFKLIVARYNTEVDFEYDTLDEALDAAWGQSENGDSYALDLFEGEKLLATNRDGAPWVEGTTPLNAMIDKWADEHISSKFR